MFEQGCALENRSGLASQSFHALLGQLIVLQQTRSQSEVYISRTTCPPRVLHRPRSSRRVLGAAGNVREVTQVERPCRCASLSRDPARRARSSPTSGGQPAARKETSSELSTTGQGQGHPAARGQVAPDGSLRSRRPLCRCLCGHWLTCSPVSDAQHAPGTQEMLSRGRSE